MSELTENLVYVLPTSGLTTNLAIDGGGAATLECSFDNGVTFNPVGTLPGAGGELQAAVKLSNCLVKVTAVTGKVYMTPSVVEYVQ